MKPPDWLPAAKRGRPEPVEEPAVSTIRNPQSQIRNRTLPYTPRPTRAPSKRRPQVEKLLLAGRTFKQIAADLGITYGTILWTAQQVYKQHGVRTLRELLFKHRATLPAAALSKLTLPNGDVSKPPLTHEVRHLLLSGLSIPEIAAWTGANKTLIYNQRQALRKAGKKLPDARAYNGGRRGVGRVRLRKSCPTSPAPSAAILPARR